MKAYRMIAVSTDHKQLLNPATDETTADVIMSADSPTGTPTHPPIDTDRIQIPTDTDRQIQTDRLQTDRSYTGP